MQTFFYYSFYYSFFISFFFNLKKNRIKRAPNSWIKSASKQDMRLHSSSEEHHSSDSWGRNNNNNDHEKNGKTSASINNNVYSEANWESSVGVANVAGSPWSREVLSSSTNGPSVPPNSYVDSNFQGIYKRCWCNSS